MMQGLVTGLQPRIDVGFRLLNRPDLTIEFVVDTGFEGALTLPPGALSLLRQRRRDPGQDERNDALGGAAGGWHRADGGDDGHERPGPASARGRNGAGG